ncbi:beta-CASP ribonuclease aCPSF1 [archaeon]|nr:beta-CASP ribonuclease aCPSF1 [archaeon]
MAVKIIEEVKDMLPKGSEISNISFEGANIVLYTNNKEFFLDNKGVIRGIVGNIKKRVELRADPAMPLTIEKAEAEIRKIVPEGAGELNIIFDPQRSQVVIEAEKPGVAIGKAGETLKEIKKKTFWVPLVKRIPSIRSKLIENIRQVLYQNDDYRKKFLNKIGERIYGPKRKQGKTSWSRVNFLGASRQVGRSCFLLETDESKVLMDCGINVAAKDEDQYPYLSELNIEELDAVVLSHAHLDHCGLIPLLFKYGYRGPVYCTAPTRDVAALLCLDLIGISQKEAKKALYGSVDIKEMVKHTVILNYEEVTDIAPDIRLTFYNAGHTLGSSLCHFHIGEGLHNFLYSGDFNYETSNLLAPANTKYPRLETLMMEGTYGSKDDVLATRHESEDYLLGIIRSTIERGGKVLMPVLGVGRSQEVLVIVERAIREGKIPNIPVFVQGMVWDVTAIHTAYPDFFNNKVRQAIFHRNENPFLSKIFKHVGSQKEMKQVLEETGPCIILATSGMMTGGSSVEYFKNLAENNKNSLILTSYQGEGSLGRRLQQGEKEIMFTEGSKQVPLKVKMDIYSIHGFTGHSDRNQLMNFVKHLNPKPRKVIVVHGEQSKVLDLASSIHKAHRIETIAPKNLETIRLV